MNLVPEAAALDPELRGWRHHLHAHPETAFEEKATAAFVADKLRAMGLDVHEGLAGTGVVGVLRHGSSREAVGLRADLDALHIHEQTGAPHASKHEGRMHACGHDGHTTMLLGAAKALSQRKRIDGTVYFIFQPAEENEGGGRVMVEQGLFDRFPVRAVYGMHNWPSMPVGHVRDAHRAADGRVRHLRDRRDRQGRARGDAPPGQGPDAVRVARDRRAADDRLAQPASARRGRGQRDAGARGRHLERDPQRGRAARHRALVQAATCRTRSSGACARSSRASRRRSR